MNSNEFYMTTEKKIEKLKGFSNEREFRNFLIDLLRKIGFTDIIHTHRYGDPEKGKDIIAKYPHPIEGDDWYAFVVKYGRIGGGTVEIETIKGQIKQSFEYPYQGLNGQELKINKVKVVTNENFTNGAQTQITSSPELKVYNNFDFWWNEKLIPQIDKHYPDFWLPGDAFAKEYAKNFKSAVESEIEIRELSNRKIDDKQLQRLINIFVEPQLTQTYVEDSNGKKTLKRKNIHVSALRTIDEDILLSGEQGAGKTKVLNSIALLSSEIDNISTNKKIPVKLKAPQIRDSKDTLEVNVIKYIKGISGHGCKRSE